MRTKAQFGPLTMVDAIGPSGDQARNSLCDAVKFDAFILLLQANGTLYKAIAEHRK